ARRSGEPCTPPGSLPDGGRDLSGCYVWGVHNAVEISSTLPGGQGTREAFRYQAHDIYPWQAEGMVCVATRCPLGRWRSQRPGGKISFHDIMAHAFRMSR